MMRKHFKEIVILSLFLLLVSGFGIKHAVGKRKAVPADISWVTISGELGDIWIESGSCEAAIMHNTDQLVFKWPDIDLTYFKTQMIKKWLDPPANTTPDGEVCFSRGYYDDEGLAVVEERDGTAWARVWFWGKTNDGTTDLKYGLHMYGLFSHDPNPNVTPSPNVAWPPPDGGFTYVHFKRWEMESEGRGKLKQLSCTGSGNFDNVVTIEVKREDL